MNKLFTLLLGIFLLAACNQKEVERLQIENKDLRNNLGQLRSQSEADKLAGSKLAEVGSRLKGKRVRIHTTTGVIVAELYPEKAPITVLTFLSRAESGFYDGSQFHRIIHNFMIQGGDPNSKDNDPYNDGQGGPSFYIPHEFNDIAHEPGVLSMARVSDVSAGAGCQFFIMHGTASHLNNQYTAFGRVIEGMDVVNRMATAEKLTTDPRIVDRPAKPILITKMEVF